MIRRNKLMPGRTAYQSSGRQSSERQGPFHGASESKSSESRSFEPKMSRREGFMEAERAHLERVFGYRFQDLSLLGRALTHRSVPGEDGGGDYERLEFLGDAVLDLAVAHLLLEYHPNASEGELSKMRAALVNTVSLAEIGRVSALGKFIRLSKGEHEAGGAERDSLLADVVEALFGALYRESGYDAAFEIVRRVWGERLINVSPRDPKTELQELLHIVNRGVPHYLLECMEGPEHAPTFVSVVTIEGMEYGRGRGGSKKISQQEAAAQALHALAEEQRGALSDHSTSEEFSASNSISPAEPNTTGRKDIVPNDADPNDAPCAPSEPLIKRTSADSKPHKKISTEDESAGSLLETAHSHQTTTEV